MTAIRVPVRVMSAEKLTSKAGKSYFVQDVQIDQLDKRSVSTQRRYFEESRVLSAGAYTAGVTFYSVYTQDANGYKREHLCVALKDLQKV